MLMGGVQIIKFNDLKPTGKPGYRLRGDNATMVSLPIIQELLLQYNDENFGLPITITNDQIKSGGLFNPHIEDCLILTNTEHGKDYFKYCITLKKQGKMATVDMRYYGWSILTEKKGRAEERGNKISGMIINMVKGTDEVGMDAEYEYYEMLETMFGEVFR